MLAKYSSFPQAHLSNLCILDSQSASSLHTSSSNASFASSSHSQLIPAQVSSLSALPSGSVSMLTTSSDTAIFRIPRDVRPSMARGAELEHRHSAPSQLLSDSTDLLSVPITQYSRSPSSLPREISTMSAAELLIEAAVTGAELDSSNQDYLLPSRSSSSSTGNTPPS